MTPMIIGESVAGDSHIRQQKNRQDNYLIVDNPVFTEPLTGNRKHSVLIKGSTDEIRHKRLESTAGIYYKTLPEDVRIIAVADGHGSDSCPYSEFGSQFAVEVFCDLMAEMVCHYKDDLGSLFSVFNRDGESTEIAQMIVKAWEAKVENHYNRNIQKTMDEAVLYESKPTSMKVGTVRVDVPESEKQIRNKNIWKMYGTTLLGMLIVENKAFCLQLGDGDITYVSKDEITPVIEPDKLLGVETHSISKPDSWKEVKTRVIRLKEDTTEPFMYVLSSDGMMNSHATEQDFHKTCLDYMNYIQEYGAETIQSNLKDWLSETSRLGCGDDITVVCIYFSP